MIDRVVVINLKNRPDRLAKFTERVGPHFPQFEVFQAIRPTDRDGFPTIGQRGCFLSHMEVLKSHKSGNLLIMEDDVIFRDDFKNFFPEIEACRLWDIFYFGVRLKTYHFEENLIQFDEGWHTHAILIREAAVRKILESYERLLCCAIKMHIDVWLSKQQQIRKFTFRETLAVQAPGYSDGDDIEKSEWTKIFHSPVDEILFRKNCRFDLPIVPPKVRKR
jgi:GR25 family glycosyltransferase involved in LPS biosynthesis